MKNIVIVSIARTPITKFCSGSLNGFKGSELGSIAIKGAISKVINDHDSNIIDIHEAFLGNVVSAGMGQAPARQAVLGAGLPTSTICTTVNKVCASGMKSIILAAQSLQCYSYSTKNMMMLAGGFESMSNIPHYLPKSRKGLTRLGHVNLIDGVIHDGLWDVYNDQHMGMCGEKCARDYHISREEQDEYAIESYRRSREAIRTNVFEEIVPIVVPSRHRQGDDLIVDTDEEPTAVQIKKIPTLKPAFDTSERGTITAGNASSLNDGAAALVLMTEDAAAERGILPLAKILGYGEAEQYPANFTTSPALAVKAAMEHASVSTIDYHEINEAFAVVALANMRLLNLDHNRVNVFGGAVSLGHPIGMSGARIVGTLYDVLKHNNGSVGCASICNGGGGASAIIIEQLN
eukprot:CAMPEP_0194133132 /NCGR_PEP_ID=MMETSP0152-20130528/3424_1 /TAXON_ID=1049557 /ORGANISM="Thalassiothrix antarctica, Strain L6-D1" /LENGTH=404 /DNA_ID=CAMNT_0038828385 /DNA_START=52 /DNA_END=1266 /DNA_ORIENTATION=-